MTYLLQVTVDGELTGGESTDHEETGTNTGVRATETELLTDLDETRGGTLTGETLGLVDLGQQGIGWLGDDGSSETGNETGSEIESRRLSGGEVGFLLASDGEDVFLSNKD